MKATISNNQDLDKIRGQIPSSKPKREINKITNKHYTKRTNGAALFQKVATLTELVKRKLDVMESDQLMPNQTQNLLTRV